MSSAFNSLVTKIENYYADRDYTTQDAEYLSRLAILEYASEKNALVASARQVSSDSIEQVINIAVKNNLKAEPSEWMVFAAHAVDNVLGYSHEGIIASGIGEYTDFLPEGHPSRTNRPAMTASVAARSTALWVAGDPRIASEQARLDVYNAYSTRPGSVEAEYAGAKVSALVSSGYVPGDVLLPITAAFKLSFAMRSAIAKALAAVRRRHGDGRFAEEFGRLKGFFSRKNGSIFSSNGRIVGAVPNTNNFEVSFPGDADIPKGVYTLDASRTSALKAVLSKRALKKLKGIKPVNSIEMPTESEKRMAVSLDEFLATRKDAPSGWTKNEDGSFTSKSGQTSRVVETAPDGDYMTEGLGEGGKIDPTQPLFELTDKDGKTLGVAQDWAGLNKIGMSYDALNGEGETTPEEPGLDQKPGDLPQFIDGPNGTRIRTDGKYGTSYQDVGNTWYDKLVDFDHLTEPQNWSQFKDGEATYTSPDGKLKLTWEPDGDSDGEGGFVDASGIGVEYDGQSIGSFRASQRDLEEGDIGEGLAKVFEKESWFKPDNLVKSEDFGNSYIFENDRGYVKVTPEFDKSGKFTGYKVEKEASDLIDENREGSYANTARFKTKEEAFADAEKFAETINDEDKLSELLNDSYMDDPGFDQKAGSSPLADDLAKHDFLTEDGFDNNYVSPDGRVEISYSEDFEMKDDGAKRASWEDLRVKVDGKYVDTVTRQKGESFEDFTKRAADLAQLGLDNPNYAEDKKAKREADRKAREEFEKSPEQVAKREEEKFAREQQKIAQQQARESIDKEDILGKIDDLAEEIFYNDKGGSGADLGGLDFTVGDVDSDGRAKFTAYDADGEEIGYGYFNPENDDPGTVADELLALTNTYLDKKLDELEPPAGLDQKAGEPETPAKPLSEKQMEPATPKQYALLEELNSERDGIDPTTQQAIDDALANQNLTKAQMASLFGELQKKPFKPGIDPTKPTDRQINSLQGYLTTKELSPEEMTDILDQLDAGLDRAGMEALTAKLRRRPDRAEGEGFDQAAKDAPGRVAYGNGFYSSDGDNSWSRTDENGNQETVEQGTNGKWFATVYRYDRRDNSWNEVSQEGPFDNIQGALDQFGTEFDEELAKEWDELSSDQGLDQAAGTKSMFDTEYDAAHSKAESDIDEALSDYENQLNDSGLSESEIADKLAEAEDIAIKLRDASYYGDDQDVDRALVNDPTDGAFDKVGSDIKKNITDLDNRQDQRQISEQQEKADEVQAAIDGDDADFLNELLGDPSYSQYQSEIEDALADINARKGGEQPGLDQNANPTPQTSWTELDDDQKEELTKKANDFIRKWSEESPRDFLLNWFDFAKDSDANPDGRRAIEKPYNYGENYLEYLDMNDSDTYDWLVGKLNSGDTEGFDQAPGKTLSPKMMEPATEAQYNYLKNLAETKMDIDPETAQAIQEALDGKNLTKAQAGGFIGKLRDLGDKENLGQYGKPSQKMIDSVNRDVYMKGLSDEDRAELLDNLENQSKGDVSTIISRLKDLPDVEGGMEKYIDSLIAKGDSEALQRLLADERYGRWSSKMKDGLAELGAEAPGLDQRAGKPSYDFQPEVDDVRDVVDRINAEDDAEDGDLGTYNPLTKSSLEEITDAWWAYNLLSDLEQLYRNMRPKTERGKKLEADLKEAVDRLKTSLDNKLGPIEAAKRDPEEAYDTFEFDKAVSDLEDFFDYYYPSRATRDMRDGDGGMVGDNRGGGWEAALLFNEETGKWDAQMTSPGRVDESYAEEFDSQDEAADWIDDQLETQNRRAEDRDTKILSEEGIEGLIKEYGDDPEKLAEVMESISNWLRGTNRGIAEDPSRRFAEYAERLREKIASNPKA